MARCIDDVFVIYMVYDSTVMASIPCDMRPTASSFLTEFVLANLRLVVH